MRFITPNIFLLIVIWFTALACNSNEEELFLFQLMDSDYTGVDFRNDLEYNERFNPYTFRNFYNGAGVALGDINNDGLVDIFLAGNQTGNKLYLNKGDFQFEDITDQAGLAVEGIWSTGVSMADINGNGFLDIYICKSGPLGGDQRHNELFINNGDGTFTEMAKEFGIADEGLSQHAVFFDFDKDGDLDMYLLNNSARSVGINDLREGQRDVRDPFGGNKLYRNDGGKFIDISEEAGIYGSAIGYGLGVTVADVNRDGWPDLYVSNDFFEKDYLYINNGDGTFKESLEEMMTEISMGSMGADIADLDNNGWPDIFVTEMLPADLERVKTKTPFEEWDKYQANVKAGYFHQFTRNTLQRNMGYQPDSDQVHFIEVARQSGVHATDWSWGALIFDMDNDGLRDIFVANGIVKDLTDFDYVDYYVNNQNLISQYKKDSVLLTKMIDEFPSVPQQNFLFRNRGNFNFENIAEIAGMDQLTFSTGAAYADLDNDGDLDLVVNNLNGEVSIFKNNSDKLNQNHWLQLDLGSQFGTKVVLYGNEQTFYGEHNPVKGYMSSVDHRMHFGLGELTMLDSLEVYWPNGTHTIIKNVVANQLLKLDAEDERLEREFKSPEAKKANFKKATWQIPWKHQESNFVDFDRDRLRFHMISNEGPRVAIGDINGDGLDDICLPGAKEQATEIWIQANNGTFSKNQVLYLHPNTEDVEALFFDANGNGHLDLYLASGSIEFSAFNQYYQDRLYLNDGKGNFDLAYNQLPDHLQSTSFVRAFDYNGDGHLDLLVGDRTMPFAYGISVDVRILENDGKGVFNDVTPEIAPSFSKIGMTRDGIIADIDGDGNQEIILVGEWMSIKVFKWLESGYKDISSEAGFDQCAGFWNTVQALDLNGDGHLDLLVGNMGLNTRLNASNSRPLKLYINDFDQNGSIEQILTQYVGDESFPLVLKGSLLKQLPALRKQLLTYDAYKNKKLEDLFPKAILDNSVILQAHTLETSLFINNGHGKFTKQALPTLVQSSPVYAIFVDHEQKKIWLGGNQSRIKPEIGINMGSFAWVLDYGDPENLQILSANESGVFVPGEIRDIKKVKTSKGSQVAIIRNNDSIILYESN